MRVLVCWTHLSGYMRACFEALSNEEDVEVHLVYFPADAAAQFGRVSSLPTGVITHQMSDELDLDELAANIKPDVLLVCGWHIPPYRRLARRSEAFRVMTMDNQWAGKARQRLGVVSRRWYIQSLFDAVFVPGDRQAYFAGLLGFPIDRIWLGSYSGDYIAFSANASRPCRQNEFLFVGRLEAEKGVDLLLEAYCCYRNLVSNPWGLNVCGVGSLANTLHAKPGVKLNGFVQPGNLPEVFHKAKAFVLPSRFEPWGVVIHEACAAELPIICSYACGAAPALVESYWNGFVTDTGSVESLMRALVSLHELPEDARATMGERSGAIASRYTPQTWAMKLTRNLRLVGHRATT